MLRISEWMEVMKMREALGLDPMGGSERSRDYREGMGFERPRPSAETSIVELVKEDEVMAKVGPKGDPAKTIHPRYVATFGECMTARHEAVTALRDADGTWNLHLTLIRSDGGRVQTRWPFNADGPRIVMGDELLRWGVIKLGRGVWTLSESINMEGVYHGYIVMCDVPEPAPWESR